MTVLVRMPCRHSRSPVCYATPTSIPSSPIPHPSPPSIPNPFPTPHFRLHPERTSPPCSLLPRPYIHSPRIPPDFYPHTKRKSNHARSPTDPLSPPPRKSPIKTQKRKK